MPRRPPSSPSSRNRSATLAPAWALRGSPFTDIVIAASKDSSRRGNFRFGAQLKVQTRLSPAVVGFNNQRGFSAGQPRHVKGKLCFSIQPGRGGILRRLGPTLDVGPHPPPGNPPPFFLLYNPDFQPT